MIRVGITTHDNGFCNIFLHCDMMTSSEVSSNLPAFCTSFNSENRTINNQIAHL